MERPLILIHFLEFSVVIVEHSCLKYCIFTKLFQIVCLIIVHNFTCENAKYDCMLWKILCFNLPFWEFSYILLHIWNIITSSNFSKFCAQIEVKTRKMVMTVYSLSSNLCLKTISIVKPAFNQTLLHCHLKIVFTYLHILWLDWLNRFSWQPCFIFNEKHREREN